MRWMFTVVVLVVFLITCGNSIEKWFLFQSRKSVKEALHILLFLRSLKIIRNMLSQIFHIANFSLVSHYCLLSNANQQRQFKTLWDVTDMMAPFSSSFSTGRPCSSFVKWKLQERNISNQFDTHFCAITIQWNTPLIFWAINDVVIPKKNSHFKTA